jgi:RNA polymerase sigma-70 factor (ECF subfamily)
MILHSPVERVGPQPQSMVEHIPRLRRYARVLVRDRDAADDLVQDTLERASNKLHLWQPGSDMRAWLFAILHNVFVNQCGKHRLEAAFDPEQLPEVAVQAAQIDRLQIADLDKALSRISADQREVLLLVAVEQMTYEEVAKLLSIPIGTVMSRVSRARNELRRLMNGASRVQAVER